ncbi:unnamed protein product [Symbiodinium sp. CCMP2592]|nr:unnamed protein product [Symbiodinium sp. CCMP2592]
MAAAAKPEGNGMDVQGLAALWEESVSVRTAVRQTGLLMRVPPGAQLCDSTRANAVANSDVLLPCLYRMFAYELKLPYMGPLQTEIELFFRQVHIQVTEKLAYRTAGEIKKMLSFIKRKANKKEEHIDMYMAGAMRQANIAQAAREALQRARSSGSLSSENDVDEDEPVDGETDLEEFRRWLDGQPRGSKDAASASSGSNHAPSAASRAEASSRVEAPAGPVPSAPEAASSASSHVLAPAAAASSMPPLAPAEAASSMPPLAPAEAASTMPPLAPAEAASSMPPLAPAGAASSMPPPPKASSHVPLPAQASSQVLPPAEASSVNPKAEASSGSGSSSANPKRSSQAGLPSEAQATQPALKRSKVIDSADSSGVPKVDKALQSAWHVPGNCETCLKAPAECNSIAC